MKTLIPNYNRLPVTFEKGKGAWLYDTEGTAYLDAISGVGVCNLGHCHPAISKVIAEQSQQLIHTSNLYGIGLQTKLANQLTQLAKMDQVFFSNSGAESVEAAIKIARLYGHNNGIDQPTIIVANNSFHGRTMATLTASGSRKVQAGFEPLVQGFVRVEYNNIEAISAVASTNPNIVAVLVEPVQGEGGINIPDDTYLPQLHQLCNQNNWLLMLDEVQTGLCRTGQWFAHQHYNFIPDVMCLAKGLGNGFPVGATLVHDKGTSVLGPGNHGSTFGGNPLACTTALAVIKAMKDKNIEEQATLMGKSLINKLTDNLANLDGVKEVRGMGMMVAIELKEPCSQLVSAALDKKLLINVTADKVIRLLPPLIINKEEINQLVNILSSLVTGFLKAKEVA